MSVRRGEPISADDTAQRALALVMVDPRRARRTAELALRESHRSDSRAVAYRALGLAAKELHDAAAAASHLRRAIAIAGRYELPQKAAEARMSLALVLDELGQPRRALREVDQARGQLHRLPLARANMQRALILRRLGRDDEALAGYRVALAAFRRYGDRLWQARVLTNRGVLRGYRGELRLAESDLHAARRLYHQLGLPAAEAQVKHNIGFVAAQAGDVPTALAWYDDAREYLRRTGSDAVGLIDRAELLLSARLLPEARESAEAAVEACRRGRMYSMLGQARLLLARVALAAGTPDEAYRAAHAARRAFARQGRPTLAALARRIEVLAQVAVRGGNHAAVGTLRDVAAGLTGSGWLLPAWESWLDSAELAIRLGDVPTARDGLARAARGRRAGPAELRGRAWHVQALICLGTGDLPGAKRAAALGLREIEAHRATLGATELRSLTGAESVELAGIRLRLALAQGRHREALAWLQRARSAALHLPSARPAADAAIARYLAELRRIGAELSAAPTDPARSGRLLRRRRAVEALVRQRSWRTPGTGTGGPEPLSMPALLATLGENALVELFVLDGELHALVAVRGRVRHRPLGRFSPVVDEVLALRVALRRLVLGHGTAASVAAARVAVEYGATTLDRLLLAPLDDLLGDRSLVLAPTGPLHALPWPVLPRCRARPVCVVPSAALWLRATTRPVVAGDPVLVAGPEPPHAVAEVEAIGAAVAGSVVLTGKHSRTADVLRALDGAATGHIATHGEFRADNPLFSWLRLADGPLTVYDLSELRRPPAVLVLSACDSGLSAVHPGDELLGLSGALLSLGTRSIVASVGPVNDAATRELMVDLYRRFAAGAEPAAALAAAQAAVDPVALPSAYSFVCLGAG